MKKLIKVALLALSVTALFSCGNGGKKSENPKGSTWTVEFMLNNGTADVYKTIIVENNKVITEAIGDPTRDGYTFDGWYVDEACTVYFDEVGDKVTSDMKVYAKWAASGIANPNTPGQGDEGNVDDEGGSEGNESGTTLTFYFQNNWCWSDVSLYLFDSTSSEVDKGKEPWPGTLLTPTGETDGPDAENQYDMYLIEIDLSEGYDYLIINGIKDDGSGNRDQTPDLLISDIIAGDCYYMEWADGNKVGNYTPAQ